MFGAFPILAERLDQPAGALSGGQRQPPGVARALMTETRIMLIDEPSVGLAPLAIERVLATAQQLQAERGLRGGNMLHFPGRRRMTPPSIAHSQEA